MNDRAQALDKIKKLLRMKRGGTPAEIETALALAAEIAARNGIDLDAVNPDDDQRKSTISHDDVFCRRCYDSDYAGKICELFFNVDVIHRVRSYRYSVSFVGRGFEIEIATYIFKFLCGHFRRTWKTGRGRLRKRKSFVFGMFVGIRRTLEEQQPKQPNTNTALVITRQAYIDSHFGALQKVDGKKPDLTETSFQQGYIRGRETSLHKAINKPGPLQLSL